MRGYAEFRRADIVQITIPTIANTLGKPIGIAWIPASRTISISSPATDIIAPRNDKTIRVFVFIAINPPRS